MQGYTIEEERREKERAKKVLAAITCFGRETLRSEDLSVASSLSARVWFASDRRLGSKRAGAQ
jgi:hypothetical protein